MKWKFFLLITLSVTLITLIPFLNDRLSIMLSADPIDHSSPIMDTFDKRYAWDFLPEEDKFDTHSLLDLRYLNETFAGESGFIHRSEDGADFVKGDGSAIRFWAVNSSVWSSKPDELANHARFLSKRGVNMVRWHGHIPTVEEGEDLTSINEEARDKLWQLVAAMKQSGIYTTLSPYYARWLKSQPNWEIPRDSPNSQGLLFFDPVLQDAYRNWLRLLLEPINPYTGIALKDEPAIALIQLQNEDSLLFWSVDKLKGRDLDILRQQFGEWLVKKYGSLELTSTVWNQITVEGDDFNQGLISFYPVWEITQPEPSDRGKARRLADQTQFWTETMHRFNTETVHFLREDIGAKQLINAGNWKTASPVYLNDAERYSYMPSDVIGINRYYGGIHIGQDSNWAILNEQRFTDPSVLLNPQSLPTNLKQITGYPMIISESSWVPPLSYQSEGPFLVSIFQSLTGIDGFYWFATQNTQWRQPSSANGYRPSLGKWVVSTPELLGNFPAAALMYRNHYIQQGQPVVQEHRRLEDLWQRRSPLISEGQTFDPNRDREFTQTQTGETTDVTPLAFLVGPVEVSYGGETEQSTAIDMSQYINENQNQIRSITDEVEWNYEKGICILNAPKAQGVTGFLKSSGQRFELDDVTIDAANDYATVVVVSMDDRAIALSESLLVQVGTRARSTGWEQRSVSWDDDDGQAYEGFEILDYGEAPWKIENNDIVVTVRNPKLTIAHVLDMNGMLEQELPLESVGNQRRLRLPIDAKYIIFQ